MKKVLLLALSLLVLAYSCSEKQTTSDPATSPNVEEITENVDSPTDSGANDEAVDDNKDKTEILPEVPPEDTAPEDTLPNDDVPESTAQSVAVTGIKLSMYDVSLFIGESQMPIVTMSPSDASDKGEIWTSSDTSVAKVNHLGNITGISEGKCTVTVTSTSNPSVSATVNVSVKANAECTYIDGILVVNKTYPLPPSYAPGWETEAAPYLWEMIAAAKEEGLELWVKSGYRSYYDQQYIYNAYVARDGQAEADTYSARPGHSEHQTGLAYDMNSNDQAFGETPEGKWLAENCYKYGFILRYPKDKEEITGYIYEPWHIRFLGVEKATEVYESGLCLEEFLNITSQYS